MLLADVLDLEGGIFASSCGSASHCVCRHQQRTPAVTGPHVTCNSTYATKLMICTNEITTVSKRTQSFLVLYCLVSTLRYLLRDPVSML